MPLDVRVRPSSHRWAPRCAMLPVPAGLLVSTGCTRPPDDLAAVTPWQAPPAGLPPTLAVTPGRDATFAPPAPPTARSGGEQAARSVAGVLVYPIVGGLWGLVGAGAPTAGVGAIVGVPVGMAAGLGVGLAEGARAMGQDVHTPAEVEASVATVRRLLDPTRLGDCLRDTLVARSSGRLVRAPSGASGAGLRVGVEAVTLSMQREAPIIGGANPPMVLSLSVSAQLDGGADAAGPAGAAAGRWQWSAEPRRYFAATAEEGRILQSDIGLAVGMIAQRMLVELYPGSGTPPPTRRGPEAEPFRTTCPDVAPVAASGQIGGVEGVTSRR